MGVRTFLKLHSDGENLQAFSEEEMLAIKKLAIRQFALSPPIALQRSTTGGNLGTMYNSYVVPGAAVSTSSSFYGRSSTPTTQEIRNTYSTLNQTTQSAVAPTDTGSIAFPIYLDSNNNIRSCSLQDMIDTIWGPAIESLTSSSEDITNVGGTYGVYKSGQAPANTSLVSSSIVFRDTRNDTSYGTTEGVPYDTSGNPVTVDDWYLYRYNTPPVPEVSAGVPLVYPLKLTQEGNAIRPFTSAEFDPLLQSGIRYTARSAVGYRLSYNLNGSGSQKGQAITDTRRNAATFYQDQDADTYYSQHVPSGSYTAVRVYYLRLNRS